MTWTFGEIRNGGIRICKCGEVTLEDEMHLCRKDQVMDENPITAIEDEKMLMDMGRMGFLIYKGAIAEGATLDEAFRVTSAYFRGLVGGSLDNSDEEKNKPEEDR